MLNMYEIITQAEFRDKMNELILITKTNALYALDMVYPLLETNQDTEALSYLNGQGSLIDILYILQNNMTILQLDKLVPKNNDMIYFIDKFGLPSKTTQEQYEMIVNDEIDETSSDDDKKEIPYVDIPDNPDNDNMFI